MSLKEELGGFINFWFMLSCGIMLVIGLVGFFYTKFSYGTYKIK